jgi:hypothetical protein
MYHSTATFSVTVGSENLFSFKLKAQGGQRDGALAGDLSNRANSVAHNARNLFDTKEAKHIKRGKAETRLAMEKIVYHKKFNVMHQLDSAASAVFLTESMKFPTCVITIHGKMQWVHVSHPEETKVLCFDRTFSLIYNSSNVWEITSDMIHLRRDQAEPLSFPDNPQTIAQLARKNSLDEHIIAAVVRQANSDLDVSWILAEMSPQILDECAPFAQQDANILVSLARVATKLQVNAASAHQLLAANGFSANAAIEAAQRTAGI